VDVEHEGMTANFADTDLASLFPIDYGNEDFDEEPAQQRPGKRAKLTVPRWSISRTHLRQLEEIFKTVKAPSLALRQSLAEQMGVNPRQVQVWFRNRRQRVRLAKLKAVAARGPASDVERVASMPNPLAIPQKPQPQAGVVSHPGVHAFATTSIAIADPLALRADPSGPLTGLKRLVSPSTSADDTFTDDTVSVVGGMGTQPVVEGAEGVRGRLGMKRASSSAHTEHAPRILEHLGQASSARARQLHALAHEGGSAVMGGGVMAGGVFDASLRRAAHSTHVSFAPPQQPPPLSAFQPHDSYDSAIGLEPSPYMPSGLPGCDLSQFDLRSGAGAIAAAFGATAPAQHPSTVSQANNPYLQEMPPPAVAPAYEGHNGCSSQYRGGSAGASSCADSFDASARSCYSSSQSDMAGALDRSLYSLPPIHEMQSRLAQAHKLQLQLQLKMQSRFVSGLSHGIYAQSMADSHSCYRTSHFYDQQYSLLRPAVLPIGPPSHGMPEARSMPIPQPQGLFPASAADTHSALAIALPDTVAPPPGHSLLRQQPYGSRGAMYKSRPRGHGGGLSQADDESLAETLSIDDLIGGLDE